MTLPVHALTWQDEIAIKSEFERPDCYDKTDIPVIQTGNKHAI